MNWKFWKKESAPIKYRYLWEKRCPYTGKLLVKEGEPLGDIFDKPYWEKYNVMVKRGWVLRKRTIHE